MSWLEWRWLFVLAGCGPVVPVDDATNADDDVCIDRHASIEVLTTTIDGAPIIAEVYYEVGDDPRTAAHFDGRVHTIWGVAGERTLIFATDGVCRFETEAIGASGCTDDEPVRIEFVFDRFCGDPPATTGGSPMPDDNTESASESGGGWGSSGGSGSSSTSSSEGTTSTTGDATDTDTDTDTTDTTTGATTTTTTG